MGWYQVVKTINGRKYLYLQMTYREGGKVKTKNKYLGPTTSSSLSAAVSSKPIVDILDGYVPSNDKETQVINEMASQLRKGAKFPPITLDYNGNVLDGFHRLEAHRLAGLTHVLVRIRRTPKK